jgi:hypothetical protein
MPAVYEGYPCECCGNAHTLFFPSVAVPDLSKPHYFTCPKLPVAMRIAGGDRWKPVRSKPENAIEVQCGDDTGRAGS